VRPTRGCAPDSEVPTPRPDRQSGASGALLGTEPDRAQDPLSRRGEHDSTLARRTARHRAGQGPGSSRPTRRARLDAGQTHGSAQKQAGPGILPADAASTTRRWPDARLGTEAGRARDPPGRRGRQRWIPEAILALQCAHANLVPCCATPCHAAQIEATWQTTRNLYTACTRLHRASAHHLAHSSHLALHRPVSSRLAHIICYTYTISY
jgi:hypothetical protein